MPLQTVFWVHFDGLTESISSISQTLCFLKENPFSWILLVNNKSPLATSLQNCKDDKQGIP